MKNASDPHRGVGSIEGQGGGGHLLARALLDNKKRAPKNQVRNF